MAGQLRKRLKCCELNACLQSLKVEALQLLLALIARQFHLEEETLN
jgi:hypothetical protein